MKTRSSGFSRLVMFSAAAFAAALACLSTAAFAAVAWASFPLGQSMSGATCEAVPSNSDPAAQIPRARAWTINCRGWSDTPLGYIYVFPGSAGNEPPTWHDALSKRATCQTAKTENIAGLRGATASECQTTVGKAPYTVYRYGDGGLIVAEGMSALSDALQTGLKVAAGVQPPTAAVTQVSATAISADASASLAAAAAAAQNSPAYLRQRAYLLNQGWIFGTAEQDFRILATDPGASPRDRGEAELVWALNVSDEGRFADADARLAEAQQAIRVLNDPQMDAEALTYRALHLINQKKFADAEQAAKQAIDLRGQLAPSTTGMMMPALAVQRDATGAPVISAALASQLNEGGSFQTEIVSPEQRLEAQNAESYYALGIARAAQGDLEGARQNLEQADRLLTATKLPISLAWQRAEVFRQLAGVELQARQPDTALMRLRDAIAALQGTNLAGTPPEARLYVELGRAEAQAGNVDQALADFASGLDRFRQSRGTVGGSADATAAYFDLLLARVQADPGRARDYQSRYFDALQSIVNQATAQTIARLAERLNQSGGAGAGAARALEESQRQIAIKASEIQRRQESGNYPQAERDADQMALKQLQDQLAADQQNLITANPRYGQLLATAVTLDQMQAALNPGELYVKNILLDRSGYAIAISKTAVRIFAIPLSHSAATQAVTQIRRPFDTTGGLPRFDVAAAHRLYTTVFGPVQDLMPPVRHLVYDPDGSLISLPVAVLVTDDASVTEFQSRVTRFQRGEFNLDLYQNIAWLGRNTSVTLAVSPSAFLQARNFALSKAQYNFIGFGDPDLKATNDPRMFRLVADPANGTNTPACEQIRVEMTTGFPPTNMQDMIRTVAMRMHARPQDVVLGPAFTDTGLLARKDLDNYKVVFFGTHGLLPTGEDCLPEPALVTSLGQGQSDAFLDASEILQLHLDADLVVLAACNTGGAGAAVADRTGLTGSGEALGGLARDFIYAGSRGLVVSQWEVDLASTAALMAAIFSGQRETEGDAMRRAQTTLMNDARYSHPYYWGAFSLLGDGGRPMPGP